MGRVFKTQDYLRVQGEYQEDVAETEIASATIKYKDPNGTEGEWDATHDSVNRLVYYDLPLGTNLGTAGIWSFWNYYIMVDGRVIPGETWRQRIYSEGDA